jgi:hypothetical protein
MVRMQISFDEQEYMLAREQAKKLGISVAELLRRAVRDALPLEANSTWMSYASLVDSGDSRSSQSIDEVVYRKR